MLTISDILQASAAIPIGACFGAALAFADPFASRRAAIAEERRRDRIKIEELLAQQAIEDFTGLSFGELIEPGERR